MKYDANRVASSAAYSFGLLWIVCSGLVILVPDFMVQMAAHMLHAELPNVHWTLTWTGFLLGLGGWMILAGVTGGMITAIYNWLGEIK